MAQLSIYLPPFSPDYSGVASALFDMNCLTVLHDASGCTGNFIGFDEPRWYGSHSPVYCSGLREMDAIMGDDEKLIAKVTAAQESVRADMVAVVGSPVPMIVGCDVAGIAHEIEDRTSVPSFGFDTTGLRYYDYGISLACDALVTRFVRPRAKSVEPSVNILGADAIDFGITKTVDDFRALLKAFGYDCTATMPCGLSMHSLSDMASSHVNLVVSRSGMSTARLLQKRCGIPYFVGLPYGERCVTDYFQQLAHVREHCVSSVFDVRQKPDHQPKKRREGEILVIGEQVASNALRSAIEAETDMGTVTVGTLFGNEAELGRPGDVSFSQEAEIAEAVNEEKYTTVFADPFLKWLIKDPASKRFVPIPHYAVSSKIHAHEGVDLIGARFGSFLMALNQGS